MDVLQITYALRNLSKFLGVFPSDFLPHSVPSAETVIINTDTHTENGSRWLAIYKKSHSAIYFDSCGLFPFDPPIVAFLRRNCAFWEYNKQQI